MKNSFSRTKRFCALELATHGDNYGLEYHAVPIERHHSRPVASGSKWCRTWLYAAVQASNAVVLLRKAIAALSVFHSWEAKIATAGYWLIYLLCLLPSEPAWRVLLAELKSLIYSQSEKLSHWVVLSGLAIWHRLKNKHAQLWLSCKQWAAFKHFCTCQIARGGRILRAVHYIELFSPVTRACLFLKT